MSNKFSALGKALKSKSSQEKVKKSKRSSSSPKNITPKASSNDLSSAYARGRRRMGKRSDPDYEQVGIYIPRELHIEVKRCLLDQKEDFSDLVTALLKAWVDNR